MRRHTYSVLFFQLEDIIVNPKISDPRINTVACVVEGHEGDKDQPIKYPKESGPKVVIWDFCWLVFFASLLTSLVIWFYLDKLLKDAMPKTKDAKTDKTRDEDAKADEALAGTVLKMTIITFVITFLISLLSFMIRFICYEDPYLYVLVCFVAFLIPSLLILLCECRTSSDRECWYKVGFRLLLPGLFMSIHHCLWVICGIISEPYWATPIFLIECLFAFSIMYSLYLYEKDVVVGKRITEGQVRIKLHLIGVVVAFTLILLVVVFVGHGHIVNVTTAGVIEFVLTITFMWLVKNSGLQLKSFKENKADQGEGDEAIQLTAAN